MMLKKKESFCTSNVFVLRCKRTPFAFQKDSFCKPKGLLLEC